jgi:translation initiation factor 2 subunit 3
VDCPGHEAYLATMLGGASVMDTACLIIAANQTVIPQPQTAEHLIAAELMGLDRILVLQNKLDLLSHAEADESYAKIKAFVTGTPAADAPLLPISAQHGWGTQRVLELLTGMPPPPRDLQAPPRLTCVRSFDVNRPTEFRPGDALHGAVIGGTLDRGVLVVGDWLEIRPGVLRAGANGRVQAQPILTRVRGLRCETTELPYAVPGSLIAVATDLDPGLSIANGMVGQRVGAPGTLPPIVGEITVRLRKLKRDTFPFGKHRVGDRVRICSNVMATEATVTDVDDKRRLTLCLDRPLCIGEGENVAILRHHREAGRELLEGTGEIRRVVDWNDVLEADGIQEVAITHRIIQWEPMERPVFSAAAGSLTYGALLADVFANKEIGEAATTRLRIPEPALELLHKHTVWGNWADIVIALGPSVEISYADHLLEYVLGELQTPGSVNAQGQLTLRGRWKGEAARSLIRRYVAGYKRCGQCEGYDTVLRKEGRVLQVYCRRCQAGTVAGSA